MRSAWALVDWSYFVHGCFELRLLQVLTLTSLYESTTTFPHPTDNKRLPTGMLDPAKHLSCFAGNFLMRSISSLTCKGGATDAMENLDGFSSLPPFPEHNSIVPTHLGTFRRHVQI